MKKETWTAIVTMIVISFTWYLIPGLVYLCNPQNSFLTITTIFLFIQCILSDDFLNKYEALNHFNLIGKKEHNHSKIRDYRIFTTNLTISFYIIELTRPDNYLKDILKPLLSFLLWPHWSTPFLSFMITWLLVYAISNLLELIEKSIVNLMKEQNNF